MKILADESVFAPMVQALRWAGFSVVTAREAGLLGAPDTRVYAVAVKGQYVLLTLDKDFTRSRRFNPKRCAGIVVGRLFKLPVIEATRILVSALREMDEHSLKGKLAIVTREGVRFWTPRPP